ncbi:hypothetical protein AKJ09_04259 [Labilithrix luteola]|uniref:Lon N-terminal domain-containing protein n=1 Tax=Labilithrix luteola TaxID=1391654 RepID=A0A0K1PVN8_9BACT|nr:LON peptidase substrate-binding domain-containing protein [Labilithrix luteola]AKU97595.1 hypothetical protein AKJ09_04259 [Labilithrix luteola]
MSESRRKTSLEEALDAIPVFPLPQVVLFPEALLPLHIFEPRYRAMIRDCLDTHGAIAIAQLMNGEDEWGQPAFHSVCGGGVILEHHPLPDGRSNIVVLGRARLRLVELPPDDPERFPYRRAKATVLEPLDVSVPETERTALVATASMFSNEVRIHDASFVFQVPASLPAGQLADVCAGQLVVDPTMRQAILEELDPRERVQMVTSQLAIQHGAMLKDDVSRVLN